MKNRKLKILFFGLGSIGLKHAQLLSENFNFDLFAFRTQKGLLTIPDNLKIVEFDSLKNAFSIQPDIAFITNPTFLHVKTALDCAKKGINIFMEKPISNSTAQLDLLINTIKTNKIFTYVAFLMRFHPIIMKLKGLIKNEKIIYVKNINTSFIPNWRPGQDYKKSFSVDSRKGGGIILEMMHELDYNRYLFGEIKNITVDYGKQSSLDINCEDYAELRCVFKNGIKSNITLNFFSHYNERKLVIYLENKVIKADLLKSVLSIYNNGNIINKEIVKINDFNDIYLNQLKYYFQNYFENNRCIFNNIPEASILLKQLFYYRK